MDFADVWTPKIVGEELLEAVRWANRAAGRVGPAGLRSNMPNLALITSDEDFDGWPPIEIRPMRRALAPARVSQLERAIWWQATYLKDQPGAARVLKHWVRAKLTHGMTFGEACDRRGWSRPTAYRRRDEALAAISMGLAQEGVAYGRH
ncbi:hypothetical protein ATY77_26640 [Rhizobium sp. R634]|uniref:hypothetical protein n=1 Tax=Rhizobium sp. R634 TaxID=1764274 RepID=UPI000B52F84B|nr:hypothetical protein [Rhizobium sp. R634]OWV79568.1 hypothetical protein ATY77_26640 [Rhizobium sp. R634]